jgi:glycerol-3-phosphate O-acyltransferase/dihydroxyacetone phosphate acyltransferase
MFYQFMKWYLGWMVKLHFKRVYSKGQKNAPDGQPAIFASNHPGGFMEPIILTTHLKQSMHFLVLGSYLRSKWLKWFFKALKMVPIYRRDITGNQTIEKNKSTFQFVNDALKQNAHILIFPEARTHFIYKRRPLKKGIVRMSWSFLKEKSHEVMYIVPVGVNFIWPSRFRSDLFIEIGEAIPLTETDGDENAWYREKLDIIGQRMSELMFDIQDEERHSATQDLVQMYHNDHSDKVDLVVKTYKHAPNYVRKIKGFVNRIDELGKAEFKGLQKELEDYNKLRKAKGLQDIIVKKSYPLGPLYWILLFVGLPFFLLGAVLNGFSLLSGYMVKKIMVKRVEYKAAVSSAIPAVLTLIIFIVFLVLGILIHYSLLIIAFAFPLSLYLFIYELDLLDLLLQKYRWRRLSREKQEEMILLRRKILDIVN